MHGHIEEEQRMRKIAKTKVKRKFDKKLLFYIVLMAFPLAQFAVFYVGVNFQSLLMAFQQYDSFETHFYFGNDLLINFKRIGEEIGSLLVMLKNSVIVWFFASFVGTVIAVLFSYYIYKHKRLGIFFKFVLFIPSILPAVLMSSIFQNFVNNIVPVAFDSIRLMDMVETPLDVQFIVAVFYTIWIGFGTQVLLYTGAMEQISPSVIEAAELDGASPFREFWNVVLPSVLPTIGTFLVAGVAGAFLNQVNLFNFFGGSANWSVRTIGYHMFSMSQMKGGEVDYPFLSALGICCTVIAIVPTLLLRRYFAKFEE